MDHSTQAGTRVQHGQERLFWINYTPLLRLELLRNVAISSQLRGARVLEDTSVEEADDQGTPLHIAASKGHEDAPNCCTSEEACK